MGSSVLCWLENLALLGVEDQIISTESLLNTLTRSLNCLRTARSVLCVNTSLKRSVEKLVSLSKGSNFADSSSEGNKAFFA
jgi:hypothetical protein